MAGMAKALKVGRIEAGATLSYGPDMIYMLRSFTAADTDRAFAQVLKSQALPSAVIAALCCRTPQTTSGHHCGSPQAWALDSGYSFGAFAHAKKMAEPSHDQQKVA